MTLDADESRDVLRQQIDDALSGLTKAPPANCQAHLGIANALRVLLQCQRAQLTHPARGVAAWAAGLGATAGGVIVGAVEVVKLFSK